MNRWIDYSEINFGEELGRGNYGAVRKATYQGTAIAVKELFPDDVEVVKYFQREVSMLSAARHPNIVEFIGISKTRDGNFLIITEYCELLADLHNLLKKENVPWKRRVEIAFAIAKAMSFLHGRGIVHRDLKCENILITKEWNVKVCDFGFARKMDKASMKQMTICGTDWTMAPEIIMEEYYDEKADVFSYGVVLAEILSRQAPDLKTFARQMPSFGIDPKEIAQRAEDGAPPKLVDLSIHCTKVYSDDRPSFMEVVQALQDIVDAMESPPVSSTTSSMRVISQSPADNQIVSEMDNVIVKRRDVLENDSPKYFFSILNKRDYDIRASIEISGENAKISPVGSAETVSEGKIVEIFVRRQSEVEVATVSPVDTNSSIKFNCAVQVERCDIETRVDEAQGVTLFTTIEHAYTRQITFHAENLRDFDVQLEIKIEGQVLSSSGSIPIKVMVPAKQKLFLSSIKTTHNIASSWVWAQIPKQLDQVQVSKGVHLVKHPLGGGAYQILVTNSRKRTVTVEVLLEGFVTGLETNPIVGQIRPTETVILGQYSANSEVQLSWSWKE